LKAEYSTIELATLHKKKKKIIGFGGRDLDKKNRYGITEIIITKIIIY
jgi:hypothetical protein